MLGRGGGVLVGSSGRPAASAHPVHELEPGAKPIKSMWPYLHVGTPPESWRSLAALQPLTPLACRNGAQRRAGHFGRSAVGACHRY
jgi:hypothetical protein